MASLFEPSELAGILQRLDALEPAAARQWGKMDAAQMLTHCSKALEAATGAQPMKQKLLGKILGPFVRGQVLGDKPFGRNGPTDPSFIIADQRDFSREQARLRGLIEQFATSGPDAAARYVHVFFGKLDGAEWGRLMHKHLDHHLRQFGA